MECPADDLRGAFAVLSPGTSAIDGLTVHLQPCSHFAQHALCLLGDGAVGTRAHVQQQVAILADDVGQLMNDEFGSLVGIVFYVSPGSVAERSIGLPIGSANVGQLAALDIERAGGFLKRVVLVVADRVRTALDHAAVQQQCPPAHSQDVAGARDFAGRTEKSQLDHRDSYVTNY